MIQLADNIQQPSGPVAAGVGAVGVNGLLGERLIPLNEAARMFPKPGGRQVSKISLWRWTTKGIRSPYLPKGVKMTLETIKMGMTRYTSYEAISRFAASMDGQRCPATVPAIAIETKRDNRRRRFAIRRATQELKAVGFM